LFSAPLRLSLVINLFPKRANTYVSIALLDRFPEHTAQLRTETYSPTSMNDLILTNIETIPGRRITEHYGLVSGNTIRAKNIGRDIGASLKNLVGGELKAYTELMQESRQQATDRMVEQARALGANAVVNIRFSTSSVTQGAAELYVYGTAVRVE
jgi:uncharacterized protein YbjQ (UPF0145 family)